MVTGETSYINDFANLPKELAIKPQSSEFQLALIDMNLYCDNFPLETSEDKVSKIKPSAPENKSISSQPVTNDTKMSESNVDNEDEPKSVQKKKTKVKRIKTPTTPKVEKTIKIINEDDAIFDKANTLFDLKCASEGQDFPTTSTPVGNQANSEQVLDSAAIDKLDEEHTQLALSELKPLVTKALKSSQSYVTIGTTSCLMGKATLNNEFKASSLPSSSTVKYVIPETSSSDKILNMERILGYKGGPAVLLYDTRMLLLATGPLLIMIDLDKANSTWPTHGLWRAFKPTPSSQQKGTGYRQSFLRGHVNEICSVEVSRLLIILGIYTLLIVLQTSLGL